MSLDKEDPKAQQRMQAILAHLAGQLNATVAAQSLGISRKTFYEWLERARTGMLNALTDRATGRPAKPVDPQQEAFQKELERLLKDRRVLEERLRIQEAFRGMLNHPVGTTKKKGVE